MKDYRLPENRQEFFSALYSFTDKHKIWPGCVYLLLPAYKHHYGWDTQTALWFGFINSLTQHPLTSLKIFSVMPTPESINVDWFNENWARLPFDMDRVKNKRNTIPALRSYRPPSAQDWSSLWRSSREAYYSWGRLSAWSGLEFLHIMDPRLPTPDTLYFNDEGSRSHRNGMFFLLGQDDMVCDRRMENTRVSSAYPQEVYTGLEAAAAQQGKDYFRLESCLCTFKNHFFGRRYPGVYAHMLVDRLNKHKQIWGEDEAYNLTRTIIKDTLPEYITTPTDTILSRSRVFPETGVPFNAEHFLCS